MKKYFAVIVLSFFVNHLFATVRTVSNDPAKPAQYTNVQVAHDAASPGDTLYVYGSPNNYGNLQISKSITIIGAGFNTRKEGFNKTVLTIIDFWEYNMSNITLDGLVWTTLRLYSGPWNYTNITIRNCNINSGITGAVGSPAQCGSVFNNWLIENCYVYALDLLGNLSCNPVSPAANGFLVKNCIIGSLGGSIHNYNITFTNCQLGLDAGAANNFARNWNCTFNNCLFYKFNFVQWSANANNQFNNCLAFNTQSPSQTFDLNNWTGGGSGTANNCIINQNPLWVTTPALTMFVLTPYSDRNIWNPMIQAGSPAINAGSDGTDIGLTGGLIPYNFLAEPKIPVIRRYQLVNPVVPPNGAVSANVTATKAQ